VTTPESKPTTPAEAPKPEATDDNIHPGFIYQSLRKIANDHHVPLDDDAIHAWGDSLQGRHGTHTNAIKEFTDYTRNMAMGLYPTLAPQIQSGIATEHLLAPYKMVAKSVLGQDAEPNFHHPQWQRALSGNVDEKTGRAAPMSLEAWRQELLTNPEFGYHLTPNGRDHHAAVLNELNTLFQTPGGNR
jgi:hypothetical protein